MKKRDMEFSIEKDISENSELEKTIILKIEKNEYLYENKKIEKFSIEDEILKIWSSQNFKNFVILNDDSSDMKTLIYILDILKKTRLKM